MEFKDFDENKNVQSDSSGMFKYSLNKENNAVILSINYKDNENLIIPSFLDGHKIVGIGKDSFSNGSFLEINVPETVEIIERGSFSNAKFHLLRFPKKIKYFQNPFLSDDTSNEKTNIIEDNYYLNYVVLPELVEDFENLDCSSNKYNFVYEFVPKYETKFPILNSQLRFDVKNLSLYILKELFDEKIACLIAQSQKNSNSFFPEYLGGFKVKGWSTSVVLNYFKNYHSSPIINDVKKDTNIENKQNKKEENYNENREIKTLYIPRDVLFIDKVGINKEVDLKEDEKIVFHKNIEFVNGINNSKTKEIETPRPYKTEQFISNNYNEKVVSDGNIIYKLYDFPFPFAAAIDFDENAEDFIFNSYVSSKYKVIYIDVFFSKSIKSITLNNVFFEEKNIENINTYFNIYFPYPYNIGKIIIGNSFNKINNLYSIIKTIRFEDVYRQQYSYNFYLDEGIEELTFVNSDELQIEKIRQFDIYLPKSLKTIKTSNALLDIVYMGHNIYGWPQTNIEPHSISRVFNFYELGNEEDSVKYNFENKIYECGVLKDHKKDIKYFSLLNNISCSFPDESFLKNTLVKSFSFYKDYLVGIVYDFILKKDVYVTIYFDTKAESFYPKVIYYCSNVSCGQTNFLLKPCKHVRALAAYIKKAYFEQNQFPVGALKKEREYNLESYLNIKKVKNLTELLDVFDVTKFLTEEQLIETFTILKDKEYFFDVFVSSTEISAFFVCSKHIHKATINLKNQSTLKFENSKTDYLDNELNLSPEVAALWILFETGEIFSIKVNFPSRYKANYFY